MKGRLLLAVLICLGLVCSNASAAIDDYSPLLTSPNENVILTWNVIETPDVPFSLFWAGQGFWLAEAGSEMSFELLELLDDDVEGILTVGNLTVTANNSEIAQDFALGVWGLTQWMPGLVVKVGDDNRNNLNATAYAAAARLSGNYLNGTMNSRYEVLTVGDSAYDCIVFDYVQDPPLFGEAQQTHLAYEIETGVLVLCNTSYSFGTPYSLVLEVSSLPSASPDLLLLLQIAISVTGVVIVVTIIVLRRR
ncbi:MAG: hypothetical protein JSW61_12700 [Candidatus Thorarchaeota archaeon]|nr:MAG: hypothetical protein JSW61_12700 [Candidatus Thorarchaeota archaeon]